MDFRTTNYARGIRNNNPGNIISDSTHWQGETGSDGHFAVFLDMSYGIRAAAINLHSLIVRGNDTIKKVISLWAPASDGNDTTAYINHVAAQCGITANTPIDPTNTAVMLKILQAIFYQENGADAQRISNTDLKNGWNLAAAKLSLPKIGISLAVVAFFLG